MSLSSNQLDAFIAVARTRHFSRAAEALRITQSALSQRIKNLETDLELSLLVRDPSGVRLTDAGEKLLRFCQTKDAMELELLSELRGGATAGDALAGALRIGGYSSVLRSRILPALAPLLRSHPSVACELFSRELRDLPGMLLSAEADFIVLDHAWERAGIESRVIGAEELVLIESARHRTRAEVFLDHDPDDATTERFFRHQGSAAARELASYKRSFLDDIYGILDGVALGLGRAVVPRHLAEDDQAVRIARGFKPLKAPIVLHFHAQPYYSRLHRAVAEALTTV